MAKPGFWNHVAELRHKILLVLAVWCALAGVVFFFREAVLEAYVAPLRTHLGAGQTLITTGLPEQFFVYLKLSLLLASFVVLPFILIQIWRFVAPGLYKHEKAAVRPFLIGLPVLFYIGGAFFWFVVLPLIVPFFVGQQSESVRLLPAVREYVSFTLQLLLAFGLVFELPVILMLCARLGLVQARQLVAFRRYAIVLTVIVAAVLTPPDPASQILLAVPLLGLYELSIWLIRLVAPKVAQQQKSEQDPTHA
jgi:sec-independent protein translocase protein TatC